MLRVEGMLVRHNTSQPVASCQALEALHWCNVQGQHIQLQAITVLINRWCRTGAGSCTTHPTKVVPVPACSTTANMCMCRPQCWLPVQVYDADATPSYGTDTLEAFFDKALKEGLKGQELGDQAVFGVGE